MSRTSGTLARVALLLALTACQRPARPPANVLLVVVDALRADHLGCYGYARPTSPRLDAFAAEATRFTNAITSAPWTLPAMATMITSLFPSVHGAVRLSDAMRWGIDREHFVPVDVLDASRTTLAEILRDAGFRTAAFVTGAYTSRAFGMDQGFERFADNEHRSVRRNVEALLDWIDRERPARFFAYLHVIEVHGPYVEPIGEATLGGAALAEERARYATADFDPGYQGSVDGSFENLAAIRKGQLRPSPRDVAHLAALYDRGIAYVDQWIGRLVDELASRDLLERTLVIVTADHGEELFDHGGSEHGRTFYDEVLRVPLLVRLPGVGGGRVVRDQVGHIDITPTVLDLAGVPPSGFMQGRTLRPLLSGRPLPERAIVAEAAVNPGLRALRTNHAKYVQDRHSRFEALYDLDADPGERTNLCATDRRRCEPFAQQLAGWDADIAIATARVALPTPAAASIDEETGKRLRALGYAE